MKLRDNGGFCIAQEPTDSDYPQLPLNAIDSGTIDLILEADRIPEHIIRLVGDLRDRENVGSDVPETDRSDVLEQKEKNIEKILLCLQRNNGVDFTRYKRNTVDRRIARRMAIKNIKSLTGYLGLLKKEQTELDVLFRDMLIPVTGFFRDAEVFGMLMGSVFPALFKDRSRKGPLRMWVAGCSTGQEAFSMAMCPHEFFDGPSVSEDIRNMEVQIFATDLSEPAVAKARTGRYGPADIGKLPENRLKRFFLEENGTYGIKKYIRDMCVFAHHNLLDDPPFGNMDLVSCRNVMIYMDSSLQERALATFHYALREKGLLLLGRSESVSAASELFSNFDKGSKVYVKNPVPGSISRYSRSSRRTVPNTDPTVAPDNGRESFQRTAEAVLLSKFTPAGVVVDPNMEIVHIHGTISPYLGPPPGAPTFHIMKMAKKGLAFEIRNAIRSADSGNVYVSKRRIPVEHEGVRSLVGIGALRLKNFECPHYLVLFKQDGTMEHTSEGHDIPEVQGDDGGQVEGLENELIQLREDMRSVTDAMEAAYEELQSANEELQSSNEELQSLNEELETAKEELQSSNEELIVLNKELEEKQEKLNYALNYSEAVMDTLRESFLVLDANMIVQEANRAFLNKFKIREGDIIGSSLFMIQEARWDRDKLGILLNEVLPERQQIVDYELTVDFPGHGERKLLLNAKEILDSTTEKKLILFALEDITERKTRENELSDYREELELAVKERTEELKTSNLELGTRNRELQKVNERLDQFAHAATHDLQEPLRKILTFADRMRESDRFELPNKASEYLAKIESSSERMSELVKSLLNYSRVMNHRDLWKLSDLNTVVGDVLLDFELIIEEKGVRIDFDKLPKIEAVPMQMAQLFHNLIGNSLKFSSDGIAPIINISGVKMNEKELNRHPELDSNREY